MVRSTVHANPRTKAGKPRRPSGWGSGLDYSPFLRLDWLFVPDEKERAALTDRRIPDRSQSHPTERETESDRLRFSSAGGAGKIQGHCGAPTN